MQQNVCFNTKNYTQGAVDKMQNQWKNQVFAFKKVETNSINRRKMAEI